MHPKISIIVPCYNIENYILPCLESIKAQNSREVEFVFIDDGSTDGTSNILDAFCQEHENCKVYHQDNSGVSLARNHALKKCTGDFIYLLDGDDILTDHAIELMLETIEHQPCDAVMSSYVVKRNDEIIYRSIPIAPGSYIPEDLYAKCSVFPTVPQLLYKRSIITANNLFFDSTLRLGEVYDFTIRFLAYAKKIIVVPDHYFYYVIRSSSATHKPILSRDLTIIDTMRRYYEYGASFVKFPSFNLTAFKMIMAFTYNKYAKLHLKGTDVYESLYILLSDPTIRRCMTYVVKTCGKEWKDWLFASFVLTTGVKGYKLITKIM